MTGRLVAVGRFSKPHGIRGWIKVRPLTDDPDRFEQLHSVTVTGGPNIPGRVLAIEGVKYQGRRVLLKFEGVDTRDEAAMLSNRTLSVPESEVAPIEEEDTYYYYQLEGLEVRDSGGGILGKLESIMNTGSNDVYQVRSPGGKEYLVPALKKCVQRVDLEEGVMIVDREWVT